MTTQNDLEMLYKGENVAGRLKQPKRHFAWVTKTDCLAIGFIAGCILGFVWNYYFWSIFMGTL